MQSHVTNDNGLHTGGRYDNRLARLLDHASRRRWLAHSARRRGIGWILLCKVAVVPQVAVEDAGQLRGLGAEGRPPAFEEEHGHDAAIVSIRIGGKPAEARPVVRAGAGLAQHWKLAEVRPQ